MPVEHMSISASKEKYQEVVDFYVKALEPLGYKKLMDFGVACGFGDPITDFWIGQKDGDGLPIHFAFVAKDHETVDKWYEAAIAAGGKDNGKPGLRPMYTPDYYGAFVLDPLGNNIEAVYRKRENEGK